MLPLLEIDDLKVHFPIGGSWLKAPRAVVHAVDGVSLQVMPGEAVAIVGESGCGKTTLARALLGLSQPTAGSIRFKGVDLSSLHAGARARSYRREIQMVFQDPFESLNPRKSVFQTLAQPLRIHKSVPRQEIRAEVVRLLDLVGLSPGENYLNRFPHQFSGGQRQRICIARSIAPKPSLIIADEAVSALDISIRAQILALMKKLQNELGLSYLFITHDLGVVRSFCDRVIVMYLGKVVEEGPTEQIFQRPRHPYTIGLLESCPLADPIVARRRSGYLLKGDMPSPISPPKACRFHTRCWMSQEICRTLAPPLINGGGGHSSRCHFAGESEKWPVYNFGGRVQ